MSEMMMIREAPEEALITTAEKQLKRQEELITRLALLVGQMEGRLAALEKAKGQVTISHQDTLALQRLIRQRAAELMDKYSLPGKAEAGLRKAIRKAALAQYSISDLHDLPAAWLPACRTLISGWHSWIVIKGLM